MLPEAVGSPEVGSPEVGSPGVGSLGVGSPGVGSPGVGNLGSPEVGRLGLGNPAVWVDIPVGGSPDILSLALSMEEEHLGGKDEECLQ